MKYARVGVALIDEATERILLMHRVKKGHEYYAILGGYPEPGETPEQTAIREVKEETGLTITLDYVLCEVDEHAGRGKGIYYLCTEFSGTAKLGGPEAEYNNPENSFRLEWVNLKQLKDVTVYPEAVNFCVLKNRY